MSNAKRLEKRKSIIWITRHEWCGFYEYRYVSKAERDISHSLLNVFHLLLFRVGNRTRLSSVAIELTL